LADNIVLRLDAGKTTGNQPRAIGLTLVSFSRMMAHHQDKPLTISLNRLRDLPDDLWQVVMDVVTAPTVSDVLAVGLSVMPLVPPLPQPDDAVAPVAARVRDLVASIARRHT
jgi:hypothetical protein